MAKAKEVNATLERLKLLKENCNRLQMYAKNEGKKDIAEVEENANLSICMTTLCDETETILQFYILQLTKALEDAEVDVRLPIFA